MASNSLFPFTALFVVFLSCCFSCTRVSAAAIPALYVLGDSLADVGNNDYLALSVLKADFSHNGVDYPGGMATGRFSNGKNSPDYIAEVLGVPSPPAYLTILDDANKISVFLQGVNFASGGAGVLDTTNPGGQCLTLSKQILFFSTVYADMVQQLGNDKVKTHLAKSIFAILVGSNDIFDYIRMSKLENMFKITPQEYVDCMIIKLELQLKILYNLGARKFAFVGTGPVGCCPTMRDKITSLCNAKANSMSFLYGAGVASLLQKLKSELSDMNYSFFDALLTFSTMLENPASYGFTVVKTACCGLGHLNAKASCVPVSSLCLNRSDHAFWDCFHPSERATRMLTTIFFGGTTPNVYPINLKQLSTL